jgi:hypothetical protein
MLLELAAALCFGAASRDAEVPCRNPALERTVKPGVRAARTLPNSPCHSISPGPPPACRFGAEGTPTFALAGDSHAGHWRAAFEHVGRARGWSGVSLTHSSCPLQKALRDLRAPRRARCASWKDQVFAYFAQHPEITTVFVAGLSGGSGVEPSRGRSRFETSVAGYEDAWAALAPRRIVVLRDTPKFRGDTDRCIIGAVRRHARPDRRCAVRRRDALTRDPAIAAARRTGRETLDLTPFFCDSRCYPVIGGALVMRDANHMTGTYSATLGPYVLRALDRLTGT